MSEQGCLDYEANRKKLVSPLRMNHDSTSMFASVFREDCTKGSEEWQAFHTVEHDKVPAFEAVSPRSTYEPRYVNIIHINRYKAA